MIDREFRKLIEGLQSRGIIDEYFLKTALNHLGAFLELGDAGKLGEIIDELEGLDIPGDLELQSILNDLGRFLRTCPANMLAEVPMAELPRAARR